MKQYVTLNRYLIEQVGFVETYLYETILEQENKEVDLLWLEDHAWNCLMQRDVVEELVTLKKKGLIDVTITARELETDD